MYESVPHPSEFRSSLKGLIPPPPAPPEPGGYTWFTTELSHGVGPVVISPLRPVGQTSLGQPAVPLFIADAPDCCWLIGTASVSPSICPVSCAICFSNIVSKPGNVGS